MRSNLLAVLGALCVLAVTAGAVWGGEDPKYGPLPVRYGRQLSPVHTGPPGERATNRWGGALGVTARLSETERGNRLEFEDTFLFPSRLHLSRLDVWGLGPPYRAFDLNARAPSEEDEWVRVVFTDLKRFVLDLRMEDSFHRNRPADTPTQRQTWTGSLDIRRFPETPTEAHYSLVSFQGAGRDRDRSYLLRESRLTSHGHLGRFELDVAIPYHHYEDRLDPANDVVQEGFSMTSTRRVMGGDGVLSLTGSTHQSDLVAFGETAETNLIQANLQINPLLSAPGLKLRVLGRVRDTPRQVARSAHTRRTIMDREVLSYRAPRWFSASLGHERRELERTRLDRAGRTTLPRFGVPSRGTVQPFFVDETPVINELWGRLSFRWSPWLRASYFHREFDTSNESITDVVRANLPLLSWDQKRRTRLDVTWNPFSSLSLLLKLTRDQRENSFRVQRELVSAKTFGLNWAPLDGRLTLGGAVDYLNIASSHPIVDLDTNETETWTAYTGYRLTPFVEYFGEFTRLKSEGPLTSDERIATSGFRYDVDSPMEATWKLAYTVDVYDEIGRERDDFRERSITMSAEARF